jgi:hypothetical protein
MLYIGIAVLVILGSIVGIIFARRKTAKPVASDSTDKPRPGSYGSGSF